jgi:hypothetical protein
MNIPIFFLTILFLYLLLALTAPKTSFKEEFSPTINNIELGSVQIGIGKPGVNTHTLYFEKTFNKTPFLFIESLYQHNSNLTDVFTLTIQDITPSHATLLIQKNDSNDGWAQNLVIPYFAIETQAENSQDTPYNY